METLLLIPFMLPLLTVVFCLFVRNHPAWQRTASAVAVFGLFGVSLCLLGLTGGGEILVLRPGDWMVPTGIVLVADVFAAIMLAVSNGVAALVLVFAFADVPIVQQRRFYFPLYLLLLMGVNGSFLAGDIFNLYVWFEIMLLSSFVLLALGRQPRQLEGAIKYVTLNLFASMIFLSAVGLLYGAMGTLNMADLAVKIRAEPEAVLLNPTSALFLIAFSIKAGLFPLYFWLPASYHTPACATSALFAGLLTKVGVYALFRVFTLFLDQDPDFTANILLFLAATTMVSGVMGAAVQFDFRRLLSFHIISQIGYMIMGLALMSPLAIAAGIFYMVHNMAAKTNLFLVAGVAERLYGTGALKKIGGLYRYAPWLAFLFFISAFALAGIPPLSGFWAKFAVVKAGLEAEVYWIVGAALLVGAMTLFSMTKIWAEAFLKNHPDAENPAFRPPRLPRREAWLMLSPIVAMAAFTLLLGFYTEPFFRLAELASEQLLNPEYYINAVMEGSRP